MIENVLILHEITKQYWVKFNSRDENAFKVYIEDNIIKFPDINDSIYLSIMDKNVLERSRRGKKEYYWRIKQLVKRGGKQEGF